MNKISTFYFLTFTLLIVFSSCKKRFFSSVEESEILPKITVQNIDYEYFSSKAKVKYNDGNTSLGFTVQLRMKKDSVIWLSASPALGIEAIRALITPDSVRIINRIVNRYDAYSIDYLRTAFNIDLSMSSFQEMLLGNLVVKPQKGDKITDSSDAPCVILVQEKNGIRLANFIDRQTHKVTRLEITDIPTNNELGVDYTKFGMLSSYLFPYENLIQAAVKDKGSERIIKINITHNKAEISQKPLNFAFNVPKRFENK